MNEVTFIIPTIGRDTLKYSIQSILNQTNENWKLIVIFDGIDPTITTVNKKISIIKSSKKGISKNSAGNVRNFGMEFVKTRWIAFLDDDDVIANNYVETLNNELDNFPCTDVIIFRMYRTKQGDVLPQLNTDNFYESSVGISFALKTEIFKKGIQFTPSHIEDFNYLDLLRQNKYCIMISPYILYFVDSDGSQVFNKFITDNVTGNRVILNSPNSFSSPNYFLMYVFFIFLIFIFILYFKKRRPLRGHLVRGG